MPTLVKACVTTQTPDLAEAFFDNAGAVAQAIGLPKSSGTRIEAYFTEPPNLVTCRLPMRTLTLNMFRMKIGCHEASKICRPCKCRHFFCSGITTGHMRARAPPYEMDAGLAFGSGHHETTQGCLHLLAHVLKKPPDPGRRYRHGLRHTRNCACQGGVQTCFCLRQ